MTPSISIIVPPRRTGCGPPAHFERGEGEWGIDHLCHLNNLLSAWRDWYAHSARRHHLITNTWRSLPLSPAPTWSRMTVWWLCLPTVDLGPLNIRLKLRFVVLCGQMFVDFWGPKKQSILIRLRAKDVAQCHQSSLSAFSTSQKLTVATFWGRINDSSCLEFTTFPQKGRISSRARCDLGTYTTAVLWSLLQTLVKGHLSHTADTFRHRVGESCWMSDTGTNRQ